MYESYNHFIKVVNLIKFKTLYMCTYKLVKPKSFYIFFLNFPTEITKRKLLCYVKRH